MRSCVRARAASALRATVTLVVASLVASAAAAVSPTAAHGALRRPNLILILTDDLSTRLLPHLPGLQRQLAQAGMSFELTIPTAVCAPSRASILTGRYAHNHRVLSNGWRSGAKAFRQSGNEERTFAVWLADAGYTTGYLGKYLNGYDPKRYWVPPGWDRWLSQTWTDFSRTDFQVVDERGVQHTVRGTYDTDYFAQAACDFVATARTPFLAVWAPMAPHSPYEPAARHRGALRELRFDWPPSFEADPEELARLTRTRLEMMLAVEEGIECLLQALDARGLLADTYVFFTSDNGFFMGEHGFAGGKGGLFEEATRVPLFVRGPEVPVGASDALVAAQDIAPTLAELAGASAPDDLDGRSLVPLLAGDASAPRRRRVLLEHWSGYDVPLGRGLRLPRDKVVLPVDGPCTYFDLERDPYEMSGTSCEAPAVRGELARLDALAHCAGRTCRELEDGAPAPGSPVD